MPAARSVPVHRVSSAAYRELGSTIELPYMIFSFLSLAVIPALRLTNHGLVDAVEFEIVPVIAE